MESTRQLLTSLLLAGAVLSVSGASTFAGSSISSDSSGTRSVLISGKNGVGVINSRVGAPGSSVSVGSGGGGSFAATTNGGPIAFAGPAGAYAGPDGAYANAGAGPWAFPYWNDGGSYGNYGNGYYPSYDPYSSRSGIQGQGYGNGGNVGVYSSSDQNGIQSRFASVGPGGRATIVEQNGNEPPRVYTYGQRGIESSAEDFNN